MKRKRKKKSKLSEFETEKKYFHATKRDKKRKEKGQLLWNCEKVGKKQKYIDYVSKIVPKKKGEKENKEISV